MIRKSKGHWTKERCHVEALKYRTKKTFSKKCISAYTYANVRGWIDEICSHMIKPDGHWTKEKCWEESLKYKTKTDFILNSPKAYQQSWLNSWIDEICSHMQILGDKYKRCIYVYEFFDKSAYVGLTCNTTNRHNNHISNINSQVYKKIKENVLYEMKQLTGYVDIEKSKELEKYYVDIYKKNNWNVLNKSKPGGLGGKLIKWTKEKCQEEALKYNTRSKLRKRNGPVYYKILSNGWQYEMFSHMTLLQKPNGYWNKERCKEESLKYKTRSELKEKNSAVYTIILKKGWRTEMFSHMDTKIRKTRGYWTKEKCQEDALKYKTRDEFKKNSTSYQRARTNNWLDDICSHMKKYKNHDN